MFKASLTKIHAVLCHKTPLDLIMIRGREGWGDLQTSFVHGYLQCEREIAPPLSLTRLSYLYFMEKVHKCSSALPSTASQRFIGVFGLPALRAHMQRDANTFNVEVFYPHNALRLDFCLPCSI